MILEKVYDELYGMIEDLKKKINAAEKSDVSITPALQSGTKLADYEIDGTEGSIYAPDLSQRIGNMIFRSYANVSFVFDNSHYSTISLSDFVPEGETALTVMGSAAGAPLSFGFNSGKTLISAGAIDVTSTSYDVNLIVVTVPTNLGRETEHTKKTTKKK